MIMKKKSFVILNAALFGVLLSGCGGNSGPEKHQHTFSPEWTYDENQHWHAATCEHKDLKSEVGEHVDIDKDFYCDICKYDMHVVPSTVTITVVNGTGGGEVEINSSVTVTATVAEGYVFKEWQVDGEKVSDQNPYTFTATSDLTIVAITEKDVNPMAKYTRTLVMTGESFKVLNLTDSQLHDGDDFESFKHIVDTLIQKENPDMITLLGDIINDDQTYGVEVNARKTVELLDSYDIPWAPIFGNHDNLEYEVSGSKKTGGVPFLMDLFSKCENCLFIEGPEEVQGKSNYLVNVVDEDGDMVESFVFLDSFTNGLDDTNVAFYEDCIEYATELNDGKVVPSVLFDHIPILEYKNAFNFALDNECRTLTGNSGSQILSAGTAKMFPKIKELASTSTVICGHDHESAFITDYQGIKLCYARKSSFGDNKPANDFSCNTHPLGGLMLEVGSDEEKLNFARVEDLTVELKVDGHLAFHPGVLPYWRLSAAKLAFEIEMPTTGHLKFNLEGSNMQRGSIAEKDRKGEWNRLTSNVDLGTDVEGFADFGTMTLIEGNRYHYEADLSKWNLNTAEYACGDETGKLIYFHSITGGNFKITNIRWEYEKITEKDQIDLSNAVIEDIPDVSFYGLPVKPDPVVKLNGTTLKEGDDIIYDYMDNAAIGTATLRVIPSGKGAHKYKGQLVKTFNVIKGEIIRGDQFKSGVDYSKDIDAVALTSTLNIDVKFTSDSNTHINILLGDGWNNGFGYYRLDSNLKTGDFLGVTVSMLEDGYIRFAFDLSKVNIVLSDKSPITKINLLYIRGAWSDAAGYIDYSVD